MKLCSLLFGLLLCASAASAADVITRTDGTTIDTKVEEVTATTIRYRMAANPNGPIYSIPLTSVAKVVYENGYTDNFNITADATPQPAVTSTSPSDEELMRYAETLAPTERATGKMTDAELLKYVYGNGQTAEFLYNKARRYKKIGWIGGAIGLLGVGIGGIILSTDNEGTYVAGCATIWGSAAASIAWCLAFNIRANQLKRQAREMEFYSSSIIEDEILHFGNKSLTAGVSVMGNQMTRTQGYGLSLKLNF